MGGSATGEIDAPPTGSTRADVDWFKVELEAGRPTGSTSRARRAGTARCEISVFAASTTRMATRPPAPSPPSTAPAPGARTTNCCSLRRVAAATTSPPLVLYNSRIGTYRLSVTEIDTSEADRAEFKSTHQELGATTVEVGDVDNPPTGLYLYR